MPGKFQKQTVLITGASSGIGEALAVQFAREGANLVLLARRKERLNKLADILKKSGTQVVVHAGDVTRDADLKAAVAAGLKRFGALHVVIANAGFGVAGRLEDLSLEDYRRQFETNVFGVLRTIYATLPSLKKTKGRLVLMGSVSGHVSSPLASAYNMSKFAVRGLADSLYCELAPVGVSVTLISPGFVKSEIHQVDNLGKFHPEARSKIPAWIEMPTAAAAADITAAIFRRDRERIVSFHGKVFVGLQRYFPGLTAGLFKRLSHKMLRPRSQ